MIIIIRFSASFLILRDKTPEKKEYNTNFWCSFFTGKQRIMCSVIYLGDDLFMLPDVWYNGIIELPYGDRFPPYGDAFQKDEEIVLNKEYQLHCGGSLVGYCVLNTVMDVRYNNFDIRKDEEGNY